MKFSSRLLLSLLAPGLLLGMASAAEPGPSAPQPPPIETATRPTALPDMNTVATPSVAGLPTASQTVGTAVEVVPPCASGDACRPSGLIGGAGLYLIKPYFENNPAYIVNNRTGGATRQAAHVDIDSHLEAAPLVWLGYLSENGWGARARYWSFSGDTNQTLAEPIRIVTAHPAGLSLIADQPAGLTVTSQLRTYVADLEAIHDLQAGSFLFLFSAGARFVHIEQQYNAYVRFQDNFVMSLLSDHHFNGAGPVVAAEGRRPLGDSGVSLFGNARGSLLFGSAKQTATLPVEDDIGIDQRDRGLLIGELELGLEYGQMVGASRFFGQVAMVGQQWFGAGSASRSTIQTLPGNDFTGGGYAVDSDIAFLGMMVRLGVNY